MMDASRVLYEEEMAIYATVAKFAERAPTDTNSQGAGRMASASSSTPGGGGGGGGASGIDETTDRGTKMDLDAQEHMQQIHMA